MLSHPTLPIQEQLSLAPFNTLGIDVKCAYFIPIEQQSDLPEALALCRQRQLPWLLIGGGSNIVLAEDFPGVVIHMRTRGIEIREEGGDVLLEVAAGENWHELVMWSLAQGYYGLENLALIPGTVGAAPVQNIGAYGVELASLLERIEGYHCDLEQFQTLSNQQCQFAYRDSIFKGELKDRFIITRVVLRLRRDPNVAVAYQALDDYLQQQQCLEPTPMELAEAVMHIRRSKLPDPAELPNVGSFFKNPVVSAEQFQALQGEYPELVNYPQPDGRYKLAAGWLVEQSGWRGRAMGPVAVHDQQALVLINRSGGSGADILSLASCIKADVHRTFGVTLEVEPRIYGGEASV